MHTAIHLLFPIPLCIGPLTSFLDADPDLTKPPQFTAYSSTNDEASGGGASPKPRPHATPTPGGGTGSRRPKGAHFTDTEIKVLRSAIQSKYIHIEEFTLV